MKSDNQHRKCEEIGASIPERMEASALRLLAVRTHTRAELHRKLRQRNFPIDQINELLDRLEAVGYLNDAEAAQNWVRRRIRARPMGQRSMEKELKWLGLSDALVREATSQAYDEEGAELEFARRAAEKRLKALRGKDKLKERMLRFLQGRGFPPSICLEVVGDILSGEIQDRERD